LLAQNIHTDPLQVAFARIDRKAFWKAVAPPTLAGIEPVASDMPTPTLYQLSYPGWPNAIGYGISFDHERRRFAKIRKWLNLTSNSIMHDSRSHECYVKNY
jgi:hypothetical protein